MIYLEARLPDTPGSLIELIKPISQHGGNIYGILHNHDKKSNNMIPVTVWFEVSEGSIEIFINNIQKELTEKSIEITKISIGPKNQLMTVILSGHVFDTDITDTIQQLDSKNIHVLELQAKFTGFEDISNVKLNLEFPESMTKIELINVLEKISGEKNLFLLHS